MGDAEHPEVNGLLGYAGGRGTVVSRLEDVDRLPAMEKVCVVAQTTQSLDEYRAIVEKIRGRVPETVVFDTICDSTEKRQAEIKELACAMDAVFIVGGRNSANTHRLAQISESMGTPTFHIETAEEIREVPLQIQPIGSPPGPRRPTGSSSASSTRSRTPGSGPTRGDGLSPLACLRRDRRLCRHRGRLPGACRPVSPGGLLQHPAAPHGGLLRVLRPHPQPLCRPGGERPEGDLPRGGLREARTALCCHGLFFHAPVAGACLPDRSFALALARPHLYRGRTLQHAGLPKGLALPQTAGPAGTKNFFMAAAWALVIAVVPYMDWPIEISADMTVAFLFIFSIVFVRSALSDLIEIQSDRLLGRETIPVVIGEDKTRKLLNVISLLLALLIILSYPLKWDDFSQFHAFSLRILHVDLFRTL